MGEVKPFTLVPNPSGDRKVLDFELTFLDVIEHSYEFLVDRSRLLQWVAGSMLQGIPLERAMLEETLTLCENDVATIGKGIDELRKRRARVQEKLSEKGGQQ